MPELPEVEVIARGLERSVSGLSVVGVDPLWPTSIRGGTDQFVRTVQGAVIKGFSRRAKLLLAHLDHGRTLAAHLKMTGRMVHRLRPEPTPYDRVIFHLADETQLVFSDMRRFGYVAAFLPGMLQLWDFYKNLGPEPLEMTAEEFVEKLRDRRARIKSLLLDQRVVAGVGNIYADEALFRAGILPDRAANGVSPTRLASLFEHLQIVLNQAIRENGSSIRDYRDAGGNAGAFQNSFRVYGKGGQACATCENILQKIVVSGRTSTFCPSCQR